MWARSALVSGLLALAGGFWLGVDHSPSAVVDGRVVDCGSPTIPVSWLVAGSGASDPDHGARPRTPQEEREAAACRTAEERSQWLTWALLGAGFAAAMGGWTVLADSDDSPAARSA